MGKIMEDMMDATVKKVNHELDALFADAAARGGNGDAATPARPSSDAMVVLRVANAAGDAEFIVGGAPPTGVPTTHPTKMPTVPSSLPTTITSGSPSESRSLNPAPNP